MILLFETTMIKVSLISKNMESLRLKKHFKLKKIVLRCLAVRQTDCKTEINIEIYLQNHSVGNYKQV